VIETRRHLEVFAASPAPAWSPDGEYLAVAVQGPYQSGYGIRLHVINRNGSIQNLNGPTVFAINEIAWLNGPQGLLVAGQDLDGPFQQIWRIAPGSAIATRITNDLNNYTAVGVDANASALVGVQVQTITNLYAMRDGDPEHPCQITSGGGRYFDVERTPAGELLYASDSTGAAEIWTMDAKGNGQRQLTSGLGRSYAPAASPDGKTITFHSNRGGVWNIWKIGADGSTPTQLTHDSSDSTYPRFTPDGAGVVYQHLGANALQNIWKTKVAVVPRLPTETSARVLEPIVVTLSQA
jgi:Tol biopolymer transport system component